MSKEMLSSEMIFYDELPFPVIICNPISNNTDFSYYIKYINPAFEKICNIRASELIEKKCTEVLPELFNTKAQRLFSNNFEAFACKIEYNNKRYRFFGYEDSGCRKAFLIDITRKKIEKRLVINEQLFESVFDLLPIGIAFGYDDKLIIECNAALKKILGCSDGELKKNCLEHLTNTESSNLINNNIVKNITRTDGTSVWLNISSYPFMSFNCNRYTRLSIIEDITNAVNSSDALKRNEQSMRVFFNNLPGMAYRFNTSNDTPELISQGCHRLTGYVPEYFVSGNLNYNDIVFYEDRTLRFKAINDAVKNKSHFHVEYRIVTSSGEFKWVLESGQAIAMEDESVSYIEGIVLDVTDRKKKAEEIHYINTHDTLTSLYNRRYFEENKNTLDTDENLPLSVMIGNINGLRLVNDALGFKTGDKVLKDTADIIKQCCPDGCLIARTGGDEFSILMPNTGFDTAYSIMKYIKKACENIMSPFGAESHISISLGIDTKNNTDENLDDVIKNAENFMYKRKLFERKSSRSNLIESIKITLFEKSQETEYHAERLNKLVQKIAEKLELNPIAMHDLSLLSMLHDIGKIGIDDSVLKKPGKLNEEEWIQMRKHPEIGYRIAMSTPETASVAEFILCHHERWDGNGYPRGLSGKDIPLLSRILAVADAFDAMTQERIYRSPISIEEAAEEIKQNAGTQFDPYIARVFIEEVIPEEFYSKSVSN